MEALPHRNSGIPYAEPPLGDLRLKPPVAKNHLNSTTFDASEFGPGCLQPVWTTTYYSLSSMCWMSLLLVWQDIPADAISEDCLTINVFRPSNIRTEAKLPVVSIAFYKSRPLSVTLVVPIAAILDVSVHPNSNIVSVWRISRYGGGFESGSSSMFNGSFIVSRSVDRVSRYMDDTSLAFNFDTLLGNASDLCQLQLPSGATRISPRTGR
jgi:hypothetical protein